MFDLSDVRCALTSAQQIIDEGHLSCDFWTTDLGYLDLC